MNFTASDFVTTTTYSRAQALSDGVLTDADSLEEGIAREAGFTIPVALTAAVWADCVHWDEEIEGTKTAATGQSSVGRLWDVLVMACHAARRGHGSRVDFTVVRVPVDGARWTPTRTHLRLHIGPGDDANPVITITTTTED